MTLDRLFPLLFGTWGLSELLLMATRRARRRGGPAARVADAGSQSLVIGSVMSGIGLALSARRVEATAMPWPGDVMLPLAVALLVAGVALRWHAIVTLGRFFTVNVSVQPGHRVVRSGAYRVIRHPSYTGLLLAMAAGGLYLRNWLSLLAAVAPMGMALVYRMRVEEAVLGEALGEEYREYCRRTKRLVPWVY